MFRAIMEHNLMVIRISAAYHTICFRIELCFLDIRFRCPCCRTVGGTLLVLLVYQVANNAANQAAKVEVKEV